MTWPAGYRLSRHVELDSTSSEARRLAEAGEQGPLWIMAERQTAGRGRRGRVWETLTGNLAATLLLRPKAAGEAVGQLSFAAALAVADTAAHFAPQAAITLKWPNDVLGDGRKLAGILLESGQDATGPWLTVGIGINLASAPEGTEFPATAIAGLGVAPPSQDAALTLLAGRFAHWYDGWMNGGFETLRTAWLVRAGGLGLPIRARLANQETRHGLFEGIDHNGALLLNEQGRISAISAGEVFF